ncbi:MAG TPA: M28 family peptidase [Candidatus Polarisedimenticolia bacterium]|nr:M28 family peptidase [Candidatus Polarisedimenticolia bacterium]
MRRSVLLVILFLIALSIAPAQESSYSLPKKASLALNGLSAERMRADLKFLSSDLLEGRGTGQRGGELAASYIATQFELAGLKPGAPDGTYFQKVPLMGISTVAEGTSLKLEGPKGSVPLKYLDDYVAWSRTEEKVTDQSSDLIFVGYGIVAPEFQWDDYKGVDVKGKTLLMLVNDPPSTDTKLFGGPALTYYGRWTYKFEMGTRKEANGVILIHTTPSAGYGFNVVQNSWSKEQPFVGRAKGERVLSLESWITEAKAKELFTLAGKNLDEAREAAARRDFRPIPLGITVTSHIVSNVRPVETANVLGVLEGGDPQKKTEAVVFSAHYDHLGIGKEENGDKIFNGAVDNASGVSILLDLARVYAGAAEGGTRPPRSILFIAAAAEEGGLRGSQYYATHPTFPPGKIAANLNIDGIQVVGPALEYTFLGSEKTTLGPIISWAERQFGFKNVPDPEPGQGSYYRSDHFNFAKVGVPSVSIDQGDKFEGKDPALGKKIWEDYNENRYHRPSDEYDASWDFSGLVKLGRIAGSIGWVVASQPKLQSWKPGDEFLAAREASWRAGSQ